MVVEVVVVVVVSSPRVEKSTFGLEVCRLSLKKTARKNAAPFCKVVSAERLVEEE